MHHVHVKRKETLMNRYAIEEYYRIPDLHGRLDRAARRNRARALHEGAVWLWNHAKALVTPRAHAARWIARLG
jgi:hypothetical protein